MPQLRQIWQIPRAGDLARLQLVDDRLTDPADDSVTVRVAAAGLNFADVFACLGLYAATPSGPFVPGLEFAGVIEAVGSSVEGWTIGQPVMGLTRFGGYATHVNVDARYLWPLPDGWSMGQGAGHLVTSLTAWYALRELGALKPEQLVLVQSAAGGVGLAALALIERMRGEAIGTVGQAAKTAVTGLAAERIIVRDSRNFGRQLDEALAAADCDGFDLVLDAIAGGTFRPLYDRLRPGGRLVIFGAADLMPSGRRPNYAKLGWQYCRRPKLDPLAMISDNRSVMAFNLIWLWDRVEHMRRLCRELSALQPPAPHIGRTFPFAEAPAAVRYLQSGDSVGKVILANNRNSSAGIR